MEEVAGEPLFFDAEFQVDGTLLATKAWCERGHKLGGSAGTLSPWRAPRPKRLRAMAARLMQATTRQPALSPA